MSTNNVTLGFVIPWYGETIGGGAEAECREVVKLLAHSGHTVEVLTTCVRDFRSDWSTDYHPPGLSTEGGIPVRRFPVRFRDPKAFDNINGRLMQREPITAAEEECFFREMIHSQALYDYIDAHRQEYLYFFIPYMFGTTVYGSMVCPERSVLIPCLHDESYAHLNAVRRMFRSVREIAFLSPEEELLARRLYDLPLEVGILIGGPVDSSWRSNPRDFRLKYGLDKFLLYAGRIDAGKNADLLIEYFDRYVAERSTDLKLVFIGGGTPTIPDRIHTRVVLLGYLSTQDKYDCFGSSLALCVPSVMESFSIVMMESWLSERPVIVNANCAVTTDLCQRANGGLYFNGYDEFRAIVDYLAEMPSVAATLGRQGRDYVRSEYAPDIIADRYSALIQRVLSDRL